MIAGSAYRDPGGRAQHASGDQGDGGYVVLRTQWVEGSKQIFAVTSGTIPVVVIPASWLPLAGLAVDSGWVRDGHPRRACDWR